MGMFAIRLTLLLCSLTIYKSLHAASVLENSSDLWRSWLLNENEEIPSQQSPPLSRRITPKSVFIAPIFDKCQSGTRLDAMGKCVKIVRIDEEANTAAMWEALVNKLNAAFSQNSFKASAFNENTTNAKVSFSTTTETPSSTIYPKESEQINNTNGEDASGPLQFTIPFSLKNSSENIDDDNTPLIIRGNLTRVFNESGVPAEITTVVDGGEIESTSEFASEAYDSQRTTILPQFEMTFSTLYPEVNTADNVGTPNQSDTEFSTELTVESTTLFDAAAVTEPTEMPILPKRYHVYNAQQQRVYPTSSKPELPNIPKIEVTPVPSLIYSYTSQDILKLPVRFPDSAFKNESATDRAVLNRVHEYKRENDSDRGSVAGSGVVVNTNNESDISDSTISGSNSISNSNNIILSSSSSLSGSSKNDVYQKLPSNGRTRPKCDPTTGYGDCTPIKFNTLAGSDKASYLINVNRAPPVTTIIRFPGMYAKGTSVVRFPASNDGTVASSVDQQLQQQQQQQQQQQKLPNKQDDTIAFPQVDVGAASRYWESSRYPTSYWNPWDASKAHFVRIWPSNAASGSATTYNMGSDVNYNYRSQAEDYS